MLSFSTLQTVENISMYISKLSPVSTLLLSCVSGGGLQSSEEGVAIIKEDVG